MTTTTDQSTGSDTLLQVTERARAYVGTIRESEDDADFLALWLEVRGSEGTDYAYDLYFATLDGQGEGDHVERHGDLAVVVPAASIDRLRGATLDLEGAAGDESLVLLNPNKPIVAGASVPDDARDLTTPLAQRIIEVLTTQVNPAIAAHGGHANLVGVDGATAYLQLGGGCQGCASSQATLRQGIEGAIRDAVPEITQIVDVTDHASGANPYYS
jgi:Fe/S biogenesis protein NfuA